MLSASVGLLAVVALMAPAGVQAKSSKVKQNAHSKRVFYATNSAGKLLRFSTNRPRKVARRAITGLPAGVRLVGIDAS